MIIIEGIAGSGKSALRNRVLADADAHGFATSHLGQFSWLSLDATRVIVRLRQGSRDFSEADAVAAMSLDLSLHCKHNICSAANTGKLVVDRLVLSSSALLAAIYGGSSARFVESLHNVLTIKPTLIVLLTTPPEICWRRLESRRSSSRFVESWEMLQKLAIIMKDAAATWEHLSTTQIILRNSTSEADLTQIAEEIFSTMIETINP